MFEILMYLFENYMDGNISIATDPTIVITELEQAGFSRLAIGRALEWLDGLNRIQEIIPTHTQASQQAMRHYATQESEQLGLEGKGFLLYLEQLSILDSKTREIVIDRLMALERHEVNLSRIKWVVLIALFNQPDKKSALSLLQDMILSDAFHVLH